MPIATFFATGCFWGMEAIFRQQLVGVISIRLSYAGETLENPSYQTVCTDATDHAEVVQWEKL